MSNDVVCDECIFQRDKSGLTESSFSLLLKFTVFATKNYVMKQSDMLILFIIPLCIKRLARIMFLI